MDRDNELPVWEKAHGISLILVLWRTISGPGMAHVLAGDSQAMIALQCADAPA